jgi:hypothetical protein
MLFLASFVVALLAGYQHPSSLALPPNASPQSKQVLTEGQKKAVKDAEALETDTIATYNKDGEVKFTEHVSPAVLPKSLADYAKKKCDDPRPVSPRCVVCTDGTIICANVSKWASTNTPVPNKPL